MKSFFIGFVLASIGFAGVYFYSKEKNKQVMLEANSALIEKQIKNVGKLVVTEGNFSEIVSYYNSKKYMFDMLSFDKNILAVVNAEVTVAYDLHQIEYNIDEGNKIVHIISVPQAEIKMYPTVKYYEVNKSQLNPFTPEDVDEINKRVRVEIQKSIENSTLKTNAINRLVSELSNLLILTKSLGWTIQYKNQTIENNTDWNFKN